MLVGKWIICLLSVVLITVIKCEETKGFNFIKDALACEGITDSVKVLSYKIQYLSLYESLLKEIDREDDVYDQNEELFEYLHKNYLRKYDEDSKVSIIFDKQFYNCVSASVMYYAICLDLGFDTKIYSTPYHVFLKVRDNTKLFRIDLTNPVDGFDYKENRNIVIENLLLNKMITKEELNRRGIDSIYSDFVIETKEINQNNLLQIVCSNLALSYIEDEKYDMAYKKIHDALKIDPKYEDTQGKYIYIWASAMREIIKINNLEKIDTLLNDALLFPELSSDFKKSILELSSELIEDYIQDTKPISNIETIYTRCERAMEKEKFFDTEMANSKISIEIYRAYDLSKKGFYEEACDVSEKLYKQSYKKEGKIQDAYIEHSQYYISYLCRNEEFDEAIRRADSLLAQIPDYPVIQEFYIGVIITCMQRGYYDKNLDLAEKLIRKATSINPNNLKTKKAMGSLYYQFAMAMVRKKEYKKAKQYAEEGLKYDANSSNLHSTIDLIKPLIK